MRHRMAIACLGSFVLVALSVGEPAWGAIAYVVPTGTVGTQNNFGGSLGLDFNVTTPISIDQLGVFDSGSDGLGQTLNAYVYDRATAAELVRLTFTSADPGTLSGGSRFKSLPVPLILPAGFQGTMVADGYGAAEPNGNLVSPTWTTDSGGGLISFVGSGRFGGAGAFPGTPDGGPLNRYAAGTFNFAGTSLPKIEIGQPIAVPNASFELPGYGDGGFGPATSWTSSAGLNTGSYNPPTGTMFSQPIPSGGHIAFANPGNYMDSAPVGKLEANTLYVLEAEWGCRNDSPGAGHAMYLLGGATNLGYINNVNIFTGPTVPTGEFRTARGYFTANHNAAIGSDLAVRLQGGGTGQAIFDNLRLTQVTQAAVPLVNPSFESPDVTPPDGWSTGATGWTLSGAGGAYEDAGQIVPADGSQSAWINANSSLTQTLTGYPIRNGHRYILLVDVADRAATTFSGYRVDLLAGGQVVASDNNTYTVLSGGGTGFFYTTSVVDFLFDSPLAGQDLGVRLSALDLPGGIQTYFDNVRLFDIEIPEPVSALLLLIGLPAAAWRARRRV